MSANDAVTDALRRTTQLMHQELERSVLSTQMLGMCMANNTSSCPTLSRLLDESTKTMTSTSDVYSSFSTLLTTSKTLVTALEKSDWLDRLLILSSLAFFLLTVAYILKKRIIDKGLWLAFWWVKYLPLPSPSLPRVVEKVGVVGPSAVMQRVATTLSAAAATATSVVLSVTANAVPSLQHSSPNEPPPQSLVDVIAEKIQPVDWLVDDAIAESLEVPRDDSVGVQDGVKEGVVIGDEVIHAQPPEPPAVEPVVVGVDRDHHHTQSHDEL